MDVATCGDHMRCGYSRCGVYRDDFDTLTQVLEAQGAHSCDVTRRELQLDSPVDSTTGWYTKRYVKNDIEGVLIPRGSSHVASLAGTYVRQDYLFLTADPLFHGDEVLFEGDYFEVKGSKPWRNADSFSHYECDLTHLPFHETRTGNITAPSVEDARQRTKVYWDTYLNYINLNSRRFLVCYANPDYPLHRVFHCKGMDIIYTIGDPDSAPIVSGDQVTRRYNERVPTRILTVDKINATGIELQHLAAVEARNVVENHPEGSQRNLNRMGETTIHDYGSTRVYDTPYLLDYTRGLT